MDFAAIALAPRLAVLDLSDNKIKVIPDAISCLTALHTLDLSNNDISDLPPAIGFLPKLTRISLDGNGSPCDGLVGHRRRAVCGIGGRGRVLI